MSLVTTQMDAQALVVTVSFGPKHMSEEDEITKL
jgi:hypothetical protein